MSAANDKGSFAYQLEKDDENYNNIHKKATIVKKYQGTGHNAEWARV